MNRDEALIIVAHKSIYCDKPDTLSHHQKYSIAKGFLEGYEQGLKIGYEQGRSTSGEKTYEDGVRDSADLVKESCPYKESPCGDCRHCH